MRQPKTTVGIACSLGIDVLTEVDRRFGGTALTRSRIIDGLLRLLLSGRVDITEVIMARRFWPLPEAANETETGGDNGVHNTGTDPSSVS
jgi:hypothetical protein